jgi:flagellum-specific ATP synthase
MNEPVADAVRSILDGHVVLSRELAHAGHYPAIDVLQSVSRLVGEIVSPEVRSAGQRLRRLLAAHREKSDLIAIGAYQRGGDPVVDEAVAKQEALEDFLRQRPDESSSADEADLELLSLMGQPASGLDGLDELAVAALYPAGVAPGPSAIPPLNLSV